MKNKTVMVSGCFDLLHAGACRIFSRQLQPWRFIWSALAGMNLRLLKIKKPVFSEVGTLIYRKLYGNMSVMLFFGLRVKGFWILNPNPKKD